MGITVPLQSLWGPEQVAEKPATPGPVVDFFAGVSLPSSAIPSNAEAMLAPPGPVAEVPEDLHAEVQEPAGAVAVENLAEEAPEATPAPPAVIQEVAEFITGQDRDYCQPVSQADPAEPAAVIPSPEQVAISTEMAHQQRVQDAEQEYMQASMRVNEIEDEIADKKAELKEAKELWQALYVRLTAIQAGDLPDDDSDDDDIAEDETELMSQEPSQSTGEPLDGNTFPLVAENEAWKSQPLRDVIAGTAGCGPKKLDAICEMLPTLGDFVKLQEKAGGVGIHTEMPKGVGRGLCDALEEKVLNWLSVNRDKFGEAVEDATKPSPVEFHDFTPAPQEALPAQGISKEAAAPEGTDASRAADDSSTTGIEEIASMPESPPQDTSAAPLGAPESETTGAPEAGGTDAIHAAQIETRLKVLRLRDDKEPDFTVIGNQGAEAAKAGQPASACPHGASRQQDSWLLGWLSVQQ